MNRNEKFNQQLDCESTIDEAAVGMLLSYIEETNGVNLNHDVCNSVYKQMKNWLSEEVIE